MRRCRHKRKRLPTTHYGTPSMCVGDMRAYLVRRLSLTPALPLSPSPSLTSFRPSPSPAPTTFFFLPISYNTSSSLARPKFFFIIIPLLLLLLYQKGAPFFDFPSSCSSSSTKKVLDFPIFLVFVVHLLSKRCSIFSFFFFLFFFQKVARFSHFPFCCTKKVLDFSISSFSSCTCKVGGSRSLESCFMHESERGRRINESLKREKEGRSKWGFKVRLLRRGRLRVACQGVGGGRKEEE